MATRKLFSTLLLFAICVFPTSTVSADELDIDIESLKIRDQLRLKSGKVLKGKLIEESIRDGQKSVTFETVDGDILTIAVARLLDGRGVRTVDEVAQEYNSFLGKLEDTAGFHHDIVTWCLEQERGNVKFKDQVRFHRKRIMALDPNDDKVRRQLGYKYIPAVGKWVREQQYWNSIGYIRDDATWIPTLQAQQVARIKEARKTPTSSITAFRSWQRKRQRLSVAQAQAELMSFADEALLGNLYEELQDEKNPNVRAIYGEVFGQIPSSISTRGLVALYIDDASDRALDLLMQEGFNKNEATSYLVKFLDPNNTSVEANEKINRAAFAIGQMKTTGAILALADVLITTHVIKPAGNPQRMNLAFGNNGVNGMNVGGNGKPTKIPVNNEYVLQALREISEERFGYDKTDWQRWYVETYTHRSLRARR